MLKKYFLPPTEQKVSNSLSKSVDLVDNYNTLVEQNDFRHDPSQLNVVQHLQDLTERLVIQEANQQRTFADKFVLKTAVVLCKHLYIYGGVGHGKSMLMDLFFDVCPIKQKRRVHFHAFMQEVHDFIHQWANQKKNQDDVIVALATKIRKSSLLLCFDEFHVTDIADAMVMERLFRCLFNRGVIVVMTSNRHPSDLYQGGLLREQFLSFVELLLETSEIVELTGKIDYRFISPVDKIKRYHYPLNTNSDEFIQTTFKQHSRSSILKPGSINVYGRVIELTAIHEDILLTSFEELCQQPLGAADYLKIASKFNTVIMSDIPRLSPDYSDEAKRFETLIDALYEHNVIFICSAEAHPKEIYKEGEGAFEFQRTVSRLMEMQAESYRKLIRKQRV